MEFRRPNEMMLVSYEHISTPPDGRETHLSREIIGIDCKTIAVLQDEALARMSHKRTENPTGAQSPRISSSSSGSRLALKQISRGS